MGIRGEEEKSFFNQFRGTYYRAEETGKVETNSLWPANVYLRRIPLGTSTRKQR